MIIEQSNEIIFGSLYKHAPQQPLRGPVQIITKWIWPRRDKKKMVEWKTSKPDTDNMIKLLKDCMTLVGFWKDDAQVASEITEKFIGTIPGIWIHIKELENDQV